MNVDEEFSNEQQQGYNCMLSSTSNNFWCKQGTSEHSDETYDCKCGEEW